MAKKDQAPEEPTPPTPPAAEKTEEKKVIDRFARQKDIVPREKIEKTRCCVIGVGAVGRNVALMLASIGVRNIQLIDFDRIELTNVTTQGYRQMDIGDSKVEAVKKAMLEIDPEIEIEAIDDRFRPHLFDAAACFCCVDSIDVREVIWNAVKDRVQFFCDGRMLGEQMHVLTVSNEKGKIYYPTTIFAKQEAQTGRCTAQSTIFTSTICAGLMLEQFTKFLRDMPPELHFTLDLLASDIVVVDASQEEAAAKANKPAVATA